MLKVQIAFEAGFAKVVVELEVLVLQVAVYPPECTYLYEVVLYMKDQQNFDLVFEVFVLSLAKLPQMLKSQVVLHKVQKLKDTASF